jgi:hypothetical protein
MLSKQFAIMRRYSIPGGVDFHTAPFASRMQETLGWPGTPVAARVRPDIIDIYVIFERPTML